MIAGGSVLLAACGDNGDTAQPAATTAAPATTTEAAAPTTAALAAATTIAPATTAAAEAVVTETTTTAPRPLKTLRFGMTQGVTSADTLDPAYRTSGSDGLFQTLIQEQIFFEVIAVTETEAQLAAIRGGQVDILSRAPATALDDLDAHADIMVVTNPIGSSSVAYCQIDTPPFDNNDLRLAIKYATDRQQQSGRHREWEGLRGAWSAHFCCGTASLESDPRRRPPFPAHRAEPWAGAGRCARRPPQ